MTISRSLRNLLIIVALAAAVDFVPGGGNASSTLLEFIYLTFFAAFVWAASRLYREHRSSLHGLGDQRRTVVYVALAVIALMLTGTSKLWNSGAGGEFAWLALLAAAGYALYAVFRSTRSY